MVAYYFGHAPGMAAPEAAACLTAGGAASLVAPDAARPTGLNAITESAQAAQSRAHDAARKATTGTGTDKAFLTLRALLALKAHISSRTHGADGPVRFYVTHWGSVRELPDIAAVRAFAEQVGGTHA